MNNQEKITAFSSSSEQNNTKETDSEVDDFGWGSFGKPPKDWPIRQVEDLFNIKKDSADPEEFDMETLVRLYSMPAFDEEAEPECINAEKIGSKKFHVPNHTLLFPKLNISKKRFWLVKHDHEDPAFCSTEYWPLLPKDDLNLEFYNQYFNSDSLINRPRLSTSSTTNSHQRIKSNLFDKVRLPVPQVNEQRKIATVLYTVDQAIEKTKKIISQTRRVRQGVSQDLFREGLNNDNKKETWLGEIPESWNVMEFSEIVDSNRNGLYKSKDAYGDGSRIAKMGNALENRVLDMSTSDRLELTEQEKEKYGLEEGDLIFARRAQEVSAAGDCCYVPALDELTVFTSSLIRVRLKKDVSSKFYVQYFDGPVGSRSIDRITTETSISGIATSDLLDLKVAVPNIEEQNEIASILWGFDEQIWALQNEMSQYKHLKRGLMQDLLSGTVRTTDTNITVPDEVAQHG